jgi:predicted O-methyltransferase YrrM
MANSRVRHFARVLATAALRRLSPDARAITDLFMPEYDTWPRWKSGLGANSHVLYGLARSLEPKTIVEIGSARGKSTCCLALACCHNGGGHVHAIDPQMVNDWSERETSGDNYSHLRANLSLFELEEWCTVHRCTSAETAANWREPIDFLFVDGDHSYEGVKSDFDLFAPWLRPEALVAFHDTTWELNRNAVGYVPTMGVPRLMTELQNQGFLSVTLPKVPGLTIMQARAGGFHFGVDVGDANRNQ